MQLEKFNPTTAELKQKAEECSSLIIKGVDDKEGYQAVHKARMDLVRTRREINKTGKELRAEAIAFQKAVIDKEKELIGIISPVEDDLKAKLRPGVHGVILSRGWQRATFLPQVWEQLPEVENFLGHLCSKAGMGRKCWTDAQTEIRVYEAEYFSEKR